MERPTLRDLGKRHPAGSIVLAVLLAVLAITVRMVLGPRLIGFPFLTFFPAILISTLVGGRTAGAICAIVSTLSAWYFFIEPPYSLALAWPSGFIAVGAFLFISALIVGVVDRLNIAYARARTSEEGRAALNRELETRVAARTAELEAANRRLQAEIEGRAAAEDQVRRLQRLEAVGQLTGGIAHDFNNMLSIVMGNLSLAARRLSAGERDVLRYIDGANEGASRAAQLTARLLAFARRQPLAPAVTDINRLVSGMSEMLRRSIGEGIEIENVRAGGLWLTEVDTGQLESAILNLAINARDAMPAGGKLTIETQNAHLDESYAAAEVEVKPGQYVVIAVSDTGAGMTEDVRARALEPFFTTKDVDKGTGLGLSQIYGFVKQTGGHVTIYSEPDHGTTVRLYLPRYHGAEAPRDPARESDDVPTGAETILVVEDDADVRRTSVEALGQLGYRVIEAGGGAEALDRLAEHGPVALLFTDVVMAGMSGRELAEEAARRQPGLRTLYTTGYTRNSIVHAGVLDPGVELLQKPFTLDQLARRVRAIIDR